MKRARRKLTFLATLAALLLAGWLFLREWHYLCQLPPDVRERMPAHFRIPAGLRPEVREAIERLYSPSRLERAWAADRLANLGRDAAPAAPFLAALLADRRIKPTTQPAGGRSSFTRRVREALLPGRPSGDARKEQFEGDWEPRHGYTSSCEGSAADALMEIGEEAIDPLVEAMSDPCSAVGDLAARALARMGHRQATGPMLEALRDDDPAVRKHAAWVLGHAGHEQAIGPLRNVLCDRQDKPEVREAAAKALIQMAGPAVERCAELLTHGHDSTRVLVLRPLLVREVSRARWGGLPREFYDWPITNARRRLLERQEVVEEPLWSDPFLAWRTARFRRVLAEMQQDANALVASHAAAVLACWGDPQAIEQLAAFLEHDLPQVRGAAADGLSAAGGARAADALLGAAREGRPNVLRAAVELLIQRDDGLDVAHLERHLAHPIPSVRWRVACALARRGDPRALPQLSRGLEEPGYYGWELGDLLAAIGRPAVEPLVEILTSDAEAEARARAARALGHVGDAVALAPLVKALEDPSPYVREEAARALGKLKDRRAADPLLAALANEEADVVCAAAGALARLGDSRGLEPLRKAWSETANEFRAKATGSAAATGWSVAFVEHEWVPAKLVRGRGAEAELILNLSESLVDLGGSGEDPLLEALEDPDEFIRIAAALALAQSASQPAIEKVVSTMGELPATARWGIVRRLGKTDTPGRRTALVRILKAEPDFAIRAEILHALHRMGDGRAVSLLMDRLKNDPERRVRRLAVRLLTEMQDARALAPMREAARDDPCLSVRRTAALAAWELARKGPTSAATQDARR